MTTNTTATPDSGATTSTADAADTTTANAKPDGYLEGEAAKAFAARDAAKAELRKLREELATREEQAAKKAAEAGEYKPLYEKEAAKRAELESRLSEYAPIVESVQAELEAKRAELGDETAAAIAKLPPSEQRMLIDRLTATPAEPKPKVPATGAPSPSGGLPPPHMPAERAHWMRTHTVEEVKQAKAAEWAEARGR